MQGGPGRVGSNVRKLAKNPTTLTAPFRDDVTYAQTGKTLLSTGSGVTTSFKIEQIMEELVS
jgi:hypothetical protein